MENRVRAVKVERAVGVWMRGSGRVEQRVGQGSG
jgi:hypothetical protein